MLTLLLSKYPHMTVTECERTTLRDVNILLTAATLREVDQQYMIHQQAFANQMIKATTHNGKSPKYKKFQQFFDYKERVRQVYHYDKKQEQFSEETKNALDVLKAINERGVRS